MSDTRSGVERIADERRRQIEVEKHSADHDDEYNGDEGLAIAAACYASPVPIYELRDRGWSKEFRDPWPWSEEDDKRPEPDATVSDDDRIRLLEKAGALIAAEIDRLLRKKTV
jgi:hypothetical protein